MPQARGPAADPKYLLSIDPSNPYNFSPLLMETSRIPPKTTDQYVFFFPHEGPWDETCFSQWFPAPFTGPRDPYDGDESEIEFPTAEHYMMYHKALLMKDTASAAKIIADKHPSAAKRLGREVKNFNRDVWGKYADRVVEEANFRKFGQNGDLKAVLLATGSRVIVEASPEDNIWGIGFNADNAEGNEADWGDNRLGRALMRVRDRLDKV